MKVRTILTIATAVALAVVGTVWIRSLVPPESPTGSLAFLSAAPELPIYDRDGRKIDLTNEKGKLLIVHFWATWCPPCVEEIDRLSEWEARYGAEGYRLVLVAVPERQSLERLRRFREERPLPGRLLWDPAGAALRALDADRVPTHILLVAGGVEAWRGSALAELGESGLEAVIEGRVSGEVRR